MAPSRPPTEDSTKRSLLCGRSGNRSETYSLSPSKILATHHPVRRRWSIFLFFFGTETAAAAQPASPLTVSRTPVPHFDVSGYPSLIVTGSYPQLSGSLGLKTVNERLRLVVIQEEERFSRFLRSEAPQIPPAQRRSLHGGFTLSIVPSFMSASTAVVSALLRMEECEPGGTGCDYWFSATLQVPSGHPVTLRELLLTPGKGIRTLARLTRLILLKSNKCIAGSPNRSGVAPSWANYREFAMTPKGLAIGFATSMAGYPSCGPVSAVVPYQSLARAFSVLGIRLVAGVRTAHLNP